MTVRARFSFTVKAYADGTPWIALEPLSGQLRGEGLPTGIFGFDLPPGTTGQRAIEIAQFLSDNLQMLTFTQLDLT